VLLPVHPWVQAPSHSIGSIQLRLRFACIFGDGRGLLKVEQLHALARECVIFAPNDHDFIVAFDRDSQFCLVTTGSEDCCRRMRAAQATCPPMSEAIPLSPTQPKRWPQILATSLADPVVVLPPGLPWIVSNFDANEVV
jgi:hypothetical protein